MNLTRSPWLSRLTRFPGALRGPQASYKPAPPSTKSAPSLDLPARFMALAMLGFLIAAGLAPFAWPLLLGSSASPHLLALVHINTVGIIAMMAMGASYQLVPVVLQQEIVSIRAGRISFWFVLAGILCFVPGLYTRRLPLLGTGASLLLIGFAIYAVVILITIWKAPRHDAIAWHLLLATTSLCGGVVFGVLLAFNEGTGFLGDLNFRLIATHFTLMIAGWVAVLLAGVAYRLAGMFSLSEQQLWWPAAWLELGLSISGAWLLAASFAFMLPLPVRILAAGLLLGGQLLVLGQLAHLYSSRRRKTFDVHIPFALTASGFGTATAVLLLVGMIQERTPSSTWWTLVIWLALVGFIETGIQGFFYKISTFLVWLHRYAKQAGRKRVPKLEELFFHRIAIAGWLLWTTGVCLSVVAIGTGESLVAHLAGAFALCGIACFLINVVAIATHGISLRVMVFQWIGRVFAHE